MQIRHAVGKNEYQRMSTEELRRHFLFERLFVRGNIERLYWETDRTVLGGAAPAGGPLTLETDPLLAAEYFCERRELGAFNLGGPGEVVVDGQRFVLGTYDGIYVGRGSREVGFSSSSEENPARFFFISYPAHVTYPARLIPRAGANRVDLGAPETANKRSIFQYIHEGGAQSCQLVTGMTQLNTGSIWNTMPPHTHSRRSEVYFYFGLPEEGVVVHLMGPKDETRHLVIHNEQAVLSPIWSIHAGCGSEAYSFIWSMGGENQRFTDMDGIKLSELK